VVARQQNQRHQDFNAPLLLRRLYRGHGVAIFAKVQQHQSGSTNCGGIHTEKKRKGRKSQFLFTAQLLRKTNLAEISSKPDLERSLTKKKLWQSPII
jgi:hypothetical protein